MVTLLAPDLRFSFSQAFKVYMRRRGRRSPFRPEWFKPEDVVVDTSTPTWVDVMGAEAPPPLLNRLPFPSEVLSGAARPDFNGLRMRNPNTFRCGMLHQFADQWDSHMTGVRGYEVVRPWIRRGVHLPDFFEHFKGEFKGRSLDSVVPPPMYFQNDNDRISGFVDFVGKTILTRLAEGSIKGLGRGGVDPPPRVVNALSVEPTKPRLINSMRGVNLFCQTKNFSLTPLSDIVQNVPHRSFFSGLDDTQGYKHLSLTPESYQFCGFEFADHWFCDTTLPFGWKLSAYVYTTVGEVLSEWLKSRGIYTALWIDDRFLGLAPPI